MSFYRLSLIGLAVVGVAACSPKSTVPANGGSAASVPQAAALPVARVLSCASPVAKDASAKSLLAAYPGDAVVGTIAGPEGSEMHGVILYGNDPARRVEITFWDDAMTKVSDVSLGSQATAWTGPSGLHLGSALPEVETANGKAFGLYGFGWDYGGYVNDLKGGKLAHLAGGCSLSLRLGTAEGATIPDSLSGEKTLSSGDAAVQALAPKVETLSLGWPAPAGQSDTE